MSEDIKCYAVLIIRIDVNLVNMFCK